MSFFRSEPMSLCQMILHTESAFNCLIELGNLGKVQFRYIYDDEDLSNTQYKAEVHRCHELERMMSHMELEIDDLNIKPVIYPDVDLDEIPEASDLNDLETIIQQVYEELTRVELNIEGLRRQRNHMFEKLEVLKKVQHFLTGENYSDSVMAWSDSVVMHLIHDELRPIPKEHIHLSFLAGTIPMEKFNIFELMLWRVTMGNYLMKTAEIAFSEDDVARRSATTIKKFVFIIFFVGMQIKDKISKVCQGFSIKLFQCPESTFERQNEVVEISQALNDLDRVITQTQDHQYRILLIASADFYIWKVKVKKMLMVYHALNRMGRVRHLHVGKYLQAECWIPTNDIAAVRSALLRGVRRSSKGNPLAMFLPILNITHKRSLGDQDKPTYFSLNRFTRGFQHLIDSYGIAEYQELNPAPYTIITFPFLFAIMFGDTGHGLIMLIFGLFMLINEKSLEEKKRFTKSSSEIWDILFAGRYIITLMGAFSVYTGLIYNDFFSRSLNILGSAWSVNFNQSTVMGLEEVQLDPARPDHYRGTPYEFGFDPVWDATGENAIITSNSFKMKVAVIMGVIQMIFGLTLSAFNFIYKKESMDLFLIFLPQFLFLMAIFGYLVFLMFYKWAYYGGHSEAPYNSACAPSILIIFINMLLMKGAETPPKGCEVWMFEMQDILQIALLTVAVICIPVLLAGKPICFILQRKKIRKIKNAALRKSQFRDNVTNIRKSLLYNVEGAVTPLSAARTRKSIQIETQNVGELWIHSGIHCIESVLGAVSHTASYLRLWALSLAHDQLSSVLWHMVLSVGLARDYGIWSSVILAVVFAIWASLTVSILVVMEGLSAFLHTLRLHWVEFQSKFYSGSGEIFTPFKFQQSTAEG